MPIQPIIDVILGEQQNYRARPWMKVRGDAVQELANELRAWIEQENFPVEYLVKGSSGLGYNSRVPWVRIFNPAQSPDPTRGWYVVVLFAADGSAAYCSLNLGVTGLKAREIEQQSNFVKNFLRTELESRPGYLSQIRLADAGLGAQYEKGNVAAFELKMGQQNTDSQISAQLDWLLSLLSKLPKFAQESSMNTVEPLRDEIDALEADTYWSKDELLPLIESLTDSSPQIILTGPPGTGKTHVAKSLARYLLAGQAEDVDDLIKIVQFHPSYGYEEFVEGLRPTATPTGHIEFKTMPGVILSMAEKIEIDGLPRVLIIDELNRANVPKVFGELMYLLEYRDEEISLQLSEKFSLPKNLYIIGTMNTADRSIQGLDLALRRRFDFFEIAPNQSVMRSFYGAGRGVNRIGEKLFRGFELLNSRITERVGDRHLQVGHSYFMVGDLDEKKLVRIWQQQIIPLLEEYFFNEVEQMENFKFDDIWQ